MNPETNLSSQMQFIILCCKSEMDENDIKAIRESVTATENLEEVSMLAYGHGVYPLFYHTLLEHASDLLDQEMKDAMAYLFQSIKVTNETMTNELVYLTKLFEEHDIQVLSIKGPVLAKIAYRDISLRQFSDLDILVKHDDFLAIHRLMTKLGYVTEFYDEQYDSKALFEMKHDCPYFNPKNGITVEIHWDFFRNVYAVNNLLFEPWNNIQEVKINSQKIYTLSDEIHLLYHAVHGSKHRWGKVVWIIDIDRMIRSNHQLNWNYMIAKAEKIGVKKMFLLGIYLSNKYFNTPLPKNIDKLLHENAELSKISLDIESQIEKEKNLKSNFNHAIAFMKLRDSFSYKILSFLAYLFSPTYEERNNIMLSNKFYFLYYPLRFIKTMYVFIINKKY